MIDILSNEINWLYFFILIAVLINTLALYFGSKKAEMKFKGINEEDIIFEENFATCYFDEGRFSSQLSAIGVTKVFITKTELCIKGSFFPFTLILNLFGFTQRVKLDDIKVVSDQGRKLVLNLNSYRGQPNMVLIFLKRSEIYMYLPH